MTMNVVCMYCRERFGGSESLSAHVDSCVKHPQNVPKKMEFLPIDNSLANQLFSDINSINFEFKDSDKVPPSC